MSAAPERTGLSRSTEDYLKAIYELEAKGVPAQTTTLAAELSVAPPSVSGMIKRLSENGLLEHAPYHGVELTSTGRHAALRVLRRHRVLEAYLTSKLGYSWDTVHEEAEQLEHAVSDVLIERMALALNNPRFDPHGAPIPTVAGDVEEPESMPLTEVPVGSMALFSMVGDREPERLRFIESLGLMPGVSFRVVAKQPFRGPVTIRIPGNAGSSDEVIGHELAEGLSCTVVEELENA